MVRKCLSQSGRRSARMKGENNRCVRLIPSPGHLVPGTGKRLNRRLAEEWAQGRSSAKGREERPQEGARKGLGVAPASARLRRPRSSGGVLIVADQGGVEEEADTQSEGDGSEGGGLPCVVVDASNQGEGNDVADGGGREQNAGATRAGGFAEFRLHGHVDAAGNGSHAFFAAQLAHAVIGVQSGEGNAEAHHDCDQSDDISIHSRLLEAAFALAKKDTMRRRRKFRLGSPVPGTRKPRC